MAGPVVKTGDLRHQVVIEQKTQTGTGSRGEPQVTWSTRITRWGKIETLAGRKAEIARQLVPTATHMVTIRWNAAVTARDRVTFKGRIFNIGNLADVDEARVLLELTCTEAK